MACCLTAPSHYLNQCWLNISVALWHSAENDFTRNAQDIYPWYQFENYWFKTSTTSPRGQWVNPPALVVSERHEPWWNRSGSTLAQVMACCLTAPSHYLNQCWLNISVALWHSAENDFTRNAQDIYPWYQFENYWFKTSTTSPRGQWVNPPHLIVSERHEPCACSSEPDAAASRTSRSPRPGTTPAPPPRPATELRTSHRHSGWPVTIGSENLTSLNQWRPHLRHTRHKQTQPPLGYCYEWDSPGRSGMVLRKMEFSAAVQLSRGSIAVLMAPCNGVFDGDITSLTVQWWARLLSVTACLLAMAFSLALFGWTMVDGASGVPQSGSGSGVWWDLKKQCSYNRRQVLHVNMYLNSVL